MIKFGIISYAHVHSDSYAWALKTIFDHDGAAKLVAVSDTEPSRGRPRAEHWGAQFFENYRDMLSGSIVDAVIIASENVRHEEEIAAAAAAGIHVICEKPVGISKEQLQSMQANLQKHSIIFQTAFVCRFSAPVVDAKRLIDSGSLGAIRAISATNHGRYPGGWFGEPALSGGGAVIDHTVHAADVVRMLTRDEFGSVTAFRGANLRPDLQVEDNALIYSRLSRTGIPVSIDCSWSRHDKWPIWGDLQLNIFCEKGVIKIDAFKPHINVSSASGFEWQSLGEDLNVKLIRSFCNAVNEHRASDRRGHGAVPKNSYDHDASLRANFDDGAKAASVAFAAYSSIANNSAPVLP
jgi:predicted dehydrogenase